MNVFSHSICMVRLQTGFLGKITYQGRVARPGLRHRDALCRQRVLRERSNRPHVVALDTGMVVRSFSALTFLPPLGGSPDGTRLFGSLGRFPTVQIVEIDGTDCSISPPIAVGVGAFGMAFSHDGLRLYVTNMR